MNTENRKQEQKRPLRGRIKTKKTTEKNEPSENRGFFSSRVGVIAVVLVSFAFIIYALITLSGIRSQIREMKETLNDINDEIAIQELMNDSKSQTTNMSAEQRDDFMERVARDELDYVKEGERVFVNVAGE